MCEANEQFSLSMEHLTALRYLHVNVCHKAASGCGLAFGVILLLLVQSSELQRNVLVSKRSTFAEKILKLFFVFNI